MKDMIKKLDFESAKQAVAEKYGYLIWEDLCNSETRVKEMDFYYSQAAELMARSWTNYYVREDRNFCIDQLVANPYSRVIHKEKAQSLPLPFPEER